MYIYIYIYDKRRRRGERLCVRTYIIINILPSGRKKIRPWQNGRGKCAADHRRFCPAMIIVLHNIIYIV